MVRGLNSAAARDLEWLGEFAKGMPFLATCGVICLVHARAVRSDFRKRFLSLLSFKFREFESVMALSVLEAANTGAKFLGSDKSNGTLFLQCHLFVRYTKTYCRAQLH